MPLDDLTNQEKIDSRSIYIRNIQADIDLNHIEDHFSKVLVRVHGTMNRVTIVQNKKNKSKSYGYIEFDSNATREAVLQLDSTELNGQLIHIARKRTNKPEYLREETKLQNIPSNTSHSKNTESDLHVPPANNTRTNKQKLLFHISASLDKAH